MKIDESSLVQLYDSAVAAFPNTKMRQHATHPIVIQNVDWMPFLGMRTLFTKGLAESNGNVYEPMILFKRVNYHPQNGIEIRATDGLTYVFEQLSLGDTDVVLRCNCPDFRYRFAFYDHVDKSLYGRLPKKYVANGNGQPANPEEMPGMCKHLMKFSEVLRESGIIA